MSKETATPLSKFEPCRLCINKPSPKAIPGFYYLGEGLDRKIKECPCHKKWVKATLIKVKVKEAQLESDPEDSYLMHYDPLKDYLGKESIESVKQLIYVRDHFNTEFSHTPLYMVGKVNTQKTHIAKWLGISLIKKHHSVYYINMKDIVKLLGVTFNDDKALLNEEFLEKLLSVDLLIIDQCFKKTKVQMYASGVQFPALDSFLRERIDQRRKCTLFVSNISPLDIEKEGFSYDIQDFIERKIRESSTELVFKDEYNRINSAFKNYNLIK